MIYKRMLSAIAVMAMGVGMFGTSQAMDTVLYSKLANETINEANSGFVANINHLIQIQEQLVQLGVAGSKDYISRHPEHAEILGTVVSNANNMMNMSLEQIEEQWHQGAYMKSKGFDLEQLDHFGELFSLMDSIIHPSTSYIALKEYKRTRKSDLLARAAGELMEVVEHVSHIGAEGNGTQLSSN